MGNKKQYRILVAENNPVTREFWRNALIDSGYMVRHAEDGEKAIKIAGGFIFDLILLETHLPKIDGYEVCKRIKEVEEIKDIPVIFVSVLNDQNYKVKAFKTGAVDYITKPVALEETKWRIKSHLQIHSQIKDLQLFNNELVKREMRIIELKSEVNKMAEELGREYPYPLSKNLVDSGNDPLEKN